MNTSRALRTSVRLVAPLGVLLALGSVAVPTDAEAAREAVIYWVNDWNGAGACGDARDPDFSWGDNVGEYLAEELEDLDFDRVNEHGNRWVDFWDMADRSEAPAGDDHIAPYGIDSADIGLLYSHGARHSCGDDPYITATMGDDAGECTLTYTANGTDNDAFFGDTDLNILIMDTCQSVHKCAWEGDAYDIVSGNMSILLGFHGYSLDSLSHTWNFEDYVDATSVNGVGDNWVTDLTDFRIGSNNDECATAVVWGATSAERDGIFQWGGFADWRRTPSSFASSSFYYIEDCDAQAGERL